MKKITLINEDATSISDFPKNPLKEKWEKLYSKEELCIALDKNNIMNYSCINCHKCPKGDLWEVPKEDIELYKDYLEKVKKYNVEHNPTMIKILSKINNN